MKNMKIQRLEKETQKELNSDDVRIVAQSYDGTFTISWPYREEYYLVTIDDDWVLNRMKRLLGLIRHTVQIKKSKTSK